MDHIGIDPMGNINNGADDNASGTAVTMELARIMKLNRFKPKRTIVFCLWAGEEQHLLGSRHYCNHPLFPIEKTVAYFNIDMVGQGDEKVDFSNIYYGPKIWKLIESKLPEKILNDVNPIREFYTGNSDHASFLEKGVPGFMLKTSGFHFKYHRPRDDADLIKPELLKKTGDLVYATLDILANEPGNWIPPHRPETYYLKEVWLVNFKLFFLQEALEKLQEAKASDVDLQLAVIKEKQDLEGSTLRVDIINKLFSLSEKIEKAKRLSFYSSYRKARQNLHKGKMTIIAGLKGIKAFRDNPKWAEVLAKQGIYYIILDDPSSLFDQKGLTEKGNDIVKALNKSGLLLLAKGLKKSQEKSLLEATTKPLILIKKELPEKEVMDLLKKKDSALGLLLTQNADAKIYFAKLDEAKKILSREHLMIINEESLWAKSGQDRMITVLSEMLNAQYGWRDIFSLFNRTFRRILVTCRGEETLRR
jgi:hypothetical protein